ncbi:MAG: YceI [Paucimonas sp.]|nr:YceI [Paucimonas sp.]
MESTQQPVRVQQLRQLRQGAVGLLLFVALGLAQAVEYRNVQPEKSAINFTYKQMGVAIDGRFRKFAAQLNFDPAKPTAAKVSFDVDLASVDAGSPDADQEVVGREWLNTKSFPSARFVATSVKPTSGNKYEVNGKLTIKGQSRDVVIPATFTPAGNNGLFEGGFTIRRGDFAIGEGAWSKFDIVANDVQIKFRITAAQ